MILADKIINERKKCGWSQEELADKLSVSRQSVSKWEGAQSVPDLNKIIKMAEIFGVSTDYLLKDEMEPTDIINSVTTDSDTIPPVRKVTMEEANEFMALKKEEKKYTSVGTVLCILSPVTLIALLGANAMNPAKVSENMATMVGLLVLFAMICAAIFIFITRGSAARKYRFLFTEDFETEYGVEGMLKEKKARFENTKNTRTAAGVIAIVLSVIPLVACGFISGKDYLSFFFTDLLILVVAAAVYNFIKIGAISGPIEVLLQEGDFSHNGKRNSKKLNPIASAFWCLAVAVFLGYSFYTGDWGRSWMVWPVAGVLYAVVRSIAKTAMKLED